MKINVVFKLPLDATLCLASISISLHSSEITKPLCDVFPHRTHLGCSFLAKSPTKCPTTAGTRFFSREVYLFLWIPQRVQLSWTQTGTLGQRQTVSLSWPFTPTQTAAAAGVEVWEMVMPTARGAQGVRRTLTSTVNLAAWWLCHRHDAWHVTFTFHIDDSCVVCARQLSVGVFAVYTECVSWLWACLPDLSASQYNLVEWNQTRWWDQRFLVRTVSWRRKYEHILK